MLSMFLTLTDQSILVPVKHETQTFVLVLWVEVTYSLPFQGLTLKCRESFDQIFYIFSQLYFRFDYGWGAVYVSPD